MKIKILLCCFLLFSINSIVKSNYYFQNDSILELIKQYKYDRALLLTDRAISNDSSSVELHFLRGNILKNLFNFNKAIDSYLSALRLDSTKAQIIIELANTYKLIPDYENSLKYFAKALSYDADNLMLQFEVANCNFLLESYKTAIAEFNKLYKKDSSNCFVIKRLAYSYNKDNQPDSSIFFYQKAITLNPKDAGNIISICNLLIKKEKYQDAIVISDNFIKHDSSCLKVNSLNAYLYLKDKQYRVSINKFIHCIENQDTSKFTYKNIGIAYFRSDSYDSAKYFFEKAYSIDTSDINTLHFLGISCSKASNKKLGIYYLEKAIEESSPSHDEYALIYRNMAETCRSWALCPCEKTLSVCLKAYNENPKDSTLLIYIGYNYESCRGDKEKAIEYYTRYMKTRTKPEEDDGIRITDYKFVAGRLKELKKEINNKPK